MQRLFETFALFFELLFEDLTALVKGPKAKAQDIPINLDR
jgi:hypothetical protein